MAKKKILDKDKLWVILSVGTGTMNDADVSKFIEHVQNAFRFDESVMLIINPVRGEVNNKIEFYNAEKIIPEVVEKFNLKGIIERMNM